MTDYEALYFKLFAAMADAVEHMEKENYGLARQTLITAQQQAEEEYLSQDERIPCSRSATEVSG